MAAAELLNSKSWHDQRRRNIYYLRTEAEMKMNVPVCIREPFTVCVMCTEKL